MVPHDKHGITTTSSAATTTTAVASEEQQMAIYTEICRGMRIIENEQEGHYTPDGGWHTADVGLLGCKG